MSHSSDGIIGHLPGRDKSSGFSFNSLPRKMVTSGSLSLPPDEGSFEGIAERQERPPPKPSRIPSFKVKPTKPRPDIQQRLRPGIDEREEAEEAEGCDEDTKTPTESTIDAEEEEATVDVLSNPRHSHLSELYRPSGSDSGNGSGDSVQTSNSDSRK